MNAELKDLELELDNLKQAVDAMERREHSRANHYLRALGIGYAANEVGTLEKVRKMRDAVAEQYGELRSQKS